MAETYPSILPLPKWGLSMDRANGVWQSAITASPKQSRLTHDNQATYTITWTMRKGHARIFRQWYVEKLAGGRKWFTIDLRDQDGVGSKTVRFAVNGRPSITSFSGKTVNIQATVIERV